MYILRAVIFALLFCSCGIVLAGGANCPNYQPPSSVPQIESIYYGRWGGDYQGTSPDAAATSLCGGPNHQTGGDGVLSFFYHCDPGSTWNGSNTSFGRQTQMSCPSGYSMASVGMCSLSDHAAVSCPTCGTQGTQWGSYDSFNSSGTCIPLTEPGVACPLNQVRDLVTGQCSPIPECDFPQVLNRAMTGCEVPTCGVHQTWSSQLMQCVAAPPDCGPNQHLHGNKDSSPSDVYCEDNPQCPEGQTYGCAGGGVNNTPLSCSCYGQRYCPDGTTSGTINGIGGCWANHLNPKPQVPSNTHNGSNGPNDPGTPPVSNPGGYLPTPGGAPPTGPDGGGGGGGTGSGGLWGNNGLNPGQGLCTTGNCLCQRGKAPTGGVTSNGGDQSCPDSGVCPDGYYASSGGWCTTSKGDCPSGQHYEFSSLSCTSDSSSYSGKTQSDNDQNTDAITERLDAIKSDTGSMKNSLSDIKDSLGFGSSSSGLGARPISGSNQAVVDAWGSKYSLPSLGSTNSSCPVFSATIPVLNITATFDQFCTFDLSLLTSVMWVVWGFISIRVVLSA